MMSPKRLAALKALVTDRQIRGGLEAKLALALKDAVHEIEELQAKLNKACGGPESGCGCAARGHE